ncbi:MAG: helix-turn-helix domain-containing protein [Tetrasphaera sp.]|nr:helix-turn-helix domain-containing protein [Tetrasphaera sp.]
MTAHTLPVATDAATRIADLERRVARQEALLQREDDFHRLLEQVVLHDGALEDLCTTLAEFFGRACVVTSTDGRVLARATTTEGDTLCGECFDATGRLLVESEPTGAREFGDERDHRAFVPIVAGGSELGFLGAFTKGTAFSDTDLHLLSRAATVAALAVTKEQAVSAVESRYRAEFLRDALTGRGGVDVVDHAVALGWDIDRPLVVVVAETDEDDQRTERSPHEVRALQERFARAWGWAVRAKDSTIPVAGFSQEVVALVPVTAGMDTDEVLRVVGALVGVVRGEGGGGRRTFATGVSRIVTSPDQLSRAYAESLKAVSIGRQMQGPSALAHFDRLGIHRLLALIPESEDLRRFVHESLGELATHDTPENDDLRRTLAVLLDTNINVAETSRRLFFHYNTLRYRISKLERMLGPITTDPELQLTVAVALRIHEMRGLWAEPR